MRIFSPSPASLEHPNPPGKSGHWRIKPRTISSLAALLPIWLPALLVLTPILFLLLSWRVEQGEIWRHLLSYRLGELSLHTLILLAGVNCGVLIIGTGLAWLTTMCDFPGRKWLDGALILPLAIPAYILGFTVLGFWDFAGPWQSMLQKWLHIRPFDIRHPATVILILTGAFYPYVYILARAAFLSQGVALMEAGAMLGLSPLRSFIRVLLPAARPAIVAGCMLTSMEVLADFGTVALFNYDTFTTAIYQSWYGFFSFQAAAQLASLLLLFIALVLIVERAARGHARYTEPGTSRPRQLYLLRGRKGAAACIICCTVLSLAFLLPIGRLLWWALQSHLYLYDGFLSALYHTLLLSGTAGLACVGCALMISLARRHHPTPAAKLGAFCAGIGYALPGAVLAAGMVLSWNALQRFLPIFTGTPLHYTLAGGLGVLLLAYLVRFLAPALGSISSGLEKIRPTLTESAICLEVPQHRLVTTLYLPILTPSLISALVLVCVDVMKELPATLLLSPTGWDTFGGAHLPLHRRGSVDTRLSASPQPGGGGASPGFAAGSSSSAPLATGCCGAPRRLSTGQPRCRAWERRISSASTATG